jgi:antitoxin component of MazEF toxin-antitoxin module
MICKIKARLILLNGESIFVKIPNKIVDSANLHEGQELEIIIDESDVTVYY